MKIISIEKVNSKNKIIKIEKYDFKLLFNDRDEFEECMDKLGFYLDYLDSEIYYTKDYLAIDLALDLLDIMEERYDEIEFSTFLYTEEYIALTELFYFAIDYTFLSEEFNLFIASEYIKGICTEFTLKNHASKKKKNIQQTDSLVSKVLPKGNQQHDKKVFIANQSFFIVSNLLKLALDNENKCNLEDSIVQGQVFLNELESEYEKENKLDIYSLIEEVKDNITAQQKELRKTEKQKKQHEKKLQYKINNMYQSFINFSRKQVYKTLCNLVKKDALSVEDAAREVGVSVEEFKKAYKQFGY